MDLSELTAYANEKYQITEQFRWTDIPGLSVICHPKSGKWIALLMRQWDSNTGTQIERCDLKCGRESLSRFQKPYLSLPIRMNGNKWIDVAFDERTERSVIFQLFDQAIDSENQYGYTLVLASQLSNSENEYQDTALPFSGSTYQPAAERIPERIKEMLRLYEYGKVSVESRAKNFYRQAEFMQDYEDDVPWSGDFFCYFPTYHDLNMQQLRGYFSWRAKVRKGNFEPIATSAAYIYIYELLNGIGADSLLDALNKLKQFEIGYLDSGIGDKRIRQNLSRWMLEYAVINDLPAETARSIAEPGMIAMDLAIEKLSSCETCTDDELLSALSTLGVKKIDESPVIANDSDRGKHIFCMVWRIANADHKNGNGLTAKLFGEQTTRKWYPLSNAVYYQITKHKNSEYVLDGCRSYACRNGIWHVTAYEKLSFDKETLSGFLHETDAQLRRYLKTGRYLKSNPADEWVIPYVDAAIEAEEKERIDAARTAVTVDLSGLDIIRKNADLTRDSLLTDEETEEIDEAEEVVAAYEQEAPYDRLLDPIQLQIISMLMNGKDPSEIIKSNHLMPSMVADFINEALFDEVGDNVLTFEDDKLCIVEEYAEDIGQLLGGSLNG